jgi:hypothetical protein
MAIKSNRHFMKQRIVIPASRCDVDVRPIVRVAHILISIRDPGRRKPRLLPSGASVLVRAARFAP